MIKANELRRGNYLDYDGFFDTVDDISYNGLDLTQFSCLDYKDVDPIPLHEEWLLKFGFEKSEFVNSFNAHDFIIRANCCWMSYTSSDFSLCIANKKSNLDTSDFICPSHKSIINVHQLQNLYFALTGEELTIKIYNK